MSESKSGAGGPNRWARKHEPVICWAALMGSSLALCAMLAPRAAAQGCAMCYQNAAASGAQGQAALRHGILILLVPAMGLFFGIFGLIYRRRNVAR